MYLFKRWFREAQSIRAVFALNGKQREKRVNYFQKLIDKGILGKKYFFLLMKPELNALLLKIIQIRLSKENIKKL